MALALFQLLCNPNQVYSRVMQLYPHLLYIGFHVASKSEHFNILVNTITLSWPRMGEPWRSLITLILDQCNTEFIYEVL